MNPEVFPEGQGDEVTPSPSCGTTQTLQGRSRHALAVTASSPHSRPSESRCLHHSQLRQVKAACPPPPLTPAARPAQQIRWHLEGGGAQGRIWCSGSRHRKQKKGRIILKHSGVLTSRQFRPCQCTAYALSELLRKLQHVGQMKPKGQPIGCRMGDCRQEENKETRKGIGKSPQLAFSAERCRDHTERLGPGASLASRGHLLGIWVLPESRATRL